MDADRTSQAVVSVKDAELMLEKLHVEDGDILMLRISDQVSEADVHAVCTRLGHAIMARYRQRVLLVVMPECTDLKTLSDEDLERAGLVRKTPRGGSAADPQGAELA